MDTKKKASDRYIHNLDAGIERVPHVDWEMISFLFHDHLNSLEALSSPPPPKFNILKTGTI